MRVFSQSLRRFLICEDGPSPVEYAVMLSLIIIVCLLAISSLGTAAKKLLLPDQELRRRRGAELSRTAADAQLEGATASRTQFPPPGGIFRPRLA